MNAAAKDVLYIDIDDEITTIIDKVRSSENRIVALVLPKRATVLQSIVNMKLLKRAADQAKKHVVLVTTEAGLMPLAAEAGMFVAATPQSKPEIPESQRQDSGENPLEEPVVLDDETDQAAFTAENSSDRPVGELAARTASPITATGESIETVQISDETSDRASNTGSSAGKQPKQKRPKGATNKKLAIPNFEKFRTRLVLAIVALLIIGAGLFFALTVLPKATIAISTDSNSVPVNLTATLNTKATAVDTDQNILPAKQEQQQKTQTQQAPATGQANRGQRAAGMVTITNCSPDGSSVTIPAGTGVSHGGLTYITQKSVTLTTSTPKCQSYSGFTSADVSIVAMQAGAQYNVGDGTSFTVASGNGYTSKDVNAVASGDISGGTDTIVKVIQQSDIDSATQKLKAQDSSAVKDDLIQMLKQDGYHAIAETFNAGTPSTTASAQVGDQVDSVTVTMNATYTMLGVKENDLKQLIRADVKDQIDSGKQTLLDDGLANATFKVVNSTETSQEVSIHTVATAGPELNVTQIKQQAAGQKSGPVSDSLKANPGVTDVTINLSPFWVKSIPGNTDKITVTIDKTTVKTGTNGNRP